MGDESIHAKLERIRRPHVHIKYEVETNGALVVKELPFVMGVMGDFSGNPTDPLKPLSERNFTNIDRDNFSEVMSRISPELNFRAENTLSDDESELPVQLKFKSMEDFSPGKIVQQVEPLRKLYEARQQLQSLMSAVGRSSELSKTLDSILTNMESLESLKKSLDSEKPPA